MDGRKGSSLLAKLEEEKLRVWQRQQPLEEEARARLLDAVAAMDMEGLADSLVQEREMRELKSHVIRVSCTREPDQGSALQKEVRCDAVRSQQMRALRKLASLEEAARMRERALKLANRSVLSPKITVSVRQNMQPLVDPAISRCEDSIGDGPALQDGAVPPVSFRCRSYTDPMPTLTSSSSSRDEPPQEKRMAMNRLVSNYLSNLLSDSESGDGESLGQQANIEARGLIVGRARVHSESHIDFQQRRPRPKLQPLLRQESSAEAASTIFNDVSAGNLGLVGTGARIVAKPALPPLSPPTSTSTEQAMRLQLHAQQLRGAPIGAARTSPPNSSDQSSKGGTSSASSGITYDFSLLGVKGCDNAGEGIDEGDCTSPLTTDRSGSGASDRDRGHHDPSDRWASNPLLAPQPSRNDPQAALRHALQSGEAVGRVLISASLSVVGTNLQNAVAKPICK